MYLSSKEIGWTVLWYHIHMNTVFKTSFVTFVNAFFFSLYSQSNILCIHVWDILTPCIGGIVLICMEIYHNYMPWLMSRSVLHTYTNLCWHSSLYCNMLFVFANTYFKTSSKRKKEERVPSETLPSMISKNGMQRQRTLTTKLVNNCFVGLFPSYL